MKKVIILGASDGLGRSIAKNLIESGISVVNLSRTPCTLENVGGGGIHNISCDLASRSDIERAVEEIRANHADFDAIVVCSAMVGMQKINAITYEIFDKTWHVNTIAPLYLLSLLFDNIVKNEADILVIGTTADLKSGFPDQLAYGATKWGLRGGMQNIALELAKTPSRVIYLHCGGMNTRLHEKDHGEKISDPAAWMDPHDIANICIYILNLPKQIEISEITVNRKGRRLA